MTTIRITTVPRAATIPSAPTAVPTSPAALPTEVQPGPRPNSYDFDLTLDPDKRSLAGRGTVVVTNDQDQPLNELYLRVWANAPALARHGASANVTGVTVDGVAAPATLDRTVLKVPLAAPLAKGGTATVAFDMDVTVADRTDRTGQGRDGALYVGNALPTLAVRDAEGWNLDPYVTNGESFYSLASDWNVRLRAPEGRQLITTGSATSDTVNNGVRELKITAPAVRDFIVVATPGGYAMRQAQVGDTTVRAWAPQRDAKQADKMLSTAAESLAWYNNRFGTYDLPELDVVGVEGLGGGMEYPGVTLDDQHNSDGMLRTVIAHENAHQWFYSMVGNNEYDDPWLDESFASFVTSEFTNRKVEDVAADIARSKGVDPHPLLMPFAPSVSAPMHDQGMAYVSNIYQRGARVLADLKSEMGEAKFVAGMRSHFAQRQHGIATTAGFITTMSQAAGHDLTQWFADHGVNAVEPSADRKLDPNQ
jgi:aminopeptidase N